MRNVIKKVCLLGDGAVGKTSLIRKFVYDIFEDEYAPTIGTKITKKIEEVPEKDINLTMVIWDIQGHKSYMKVPPQYYQGAEGVLIVSDLTRPETLENLDYWLKMLIEHTGEVPMIFIGNKSDLESEAKFGSEELATMSAKFNSPFILTSAKSGDNVSQTFHELAKRMVRSM